MCEFAITRWGFAQIDYVNGLTEIFMDCETCLGSKWSLVMLNQINGSKEP